MKWIRLFFVIVAMLVLVAIFWAYINVRDRHPGYNIDLSIKGIDTQPIKVGFAAVKISPEIKDSWIDKDGDAQYDPNSGDTFEDLNGNGQFDPIWIAGFDNRRAANGIHDDLWARTMVIDDGKTRLALTSIDAIGFMHDDVVDVRSLIKSSSQITYSVISATHTHEAPDLLGLWGESYTSSGVNAEYMTYLKKQTAHSIDLAAENLETCQLKFAINENDALVVVNDTRKPLVFDQGIRLIQAISKKSGNTLGTLVAWADHPETLWDKNLLISSDFPHFLRDGIENGVRQGDSVLAEGLGGVAVFFNGAIGGLMTTNPSLPIKDPFSDQQFLEPGFKKAKAHGDYLALLSLNALRQSQDTLDQTGIAIRAKSINLSFQNPYFRLGALLGVLDRGMNGWMRVRSEVAAFSFGPAHFVTFPGEIYPEIVNGGVEAPEGQDFEIEPVEIPYVRSQMNGQYNFVFGMANDMVGYIIPKSQWDVESPFTYDNHDAPYGEVNSLGPETGPTIHSEVLNVLADFYAP